MWTMGTIKDSNKKFARDIANSIAADVQIQAYVVTEDNKKLPIPFCFETLLIHPLLRKDAQWKADNLPPGFGTTAGHTLSGKVTSTLRDLARHG
ncbi:hypothetical protein CROQUDRAFT_372188 [Cronartium quercuum f. sp. fusiforme G11]|uniref:Uncharacterized protein n=1 Tax=Cronartium quercuum f. sp. fusiforme G11 TaxID=708437 RepID=A0A9P6NKX6_9BASI|nr:hypothetical protein CROQUDRAFT_372188 [Cronartium quercuum f. sp. fusiforme G11]